MRSGLTQATCRAPKEARVGKVGLPRRLQLPPEEAGDGKKRSFLGRLLSRKSSFASFLHRSSVSSLDMKVRAESGLAVQHTATAALHHSIYAVRCACGYAWCKRPCMYHVTAALICLMDAWHGGATGLMSGVDVSWTWMISCRRAQVSEDL